MPYTPTTFADRAAPPITAAEMNKIGTGIATATTAAELAKSRMFDVRAYGAVCDDTTDDSTAIQNAINAANTAGGGTVLIPGRSYCGATTLHVPSYVTIQGVGRQASWLRKSAASTVPLLDFSGTATGYANHVHTVGLRNISIQGSNSLGPLMRTYYVDNLQVFSVKFNDNRGRMIDAVELWDSYFTHCTWESGGGSNTNEPMVHLRNSAAASGFGWGDDNCNMCWFVQCRWEDYEDGALWIEQGVSNVNNANGMFVLACKFETHRVRGIAIIFGGGTAHCHIEKVDIVSGAFAAGTTTPEVALQMASFAHSSIRDARFVGGDGVASMYNCVELYAQDGPTVLSNISTIGPNAAVSNMIQVNGGTGNIIIEGIATSNGSNTTIGGTYTPRVMPQDLGRVPLRGQAGAEYAAPPAGSQVLFSYANPVGRTQVKVQNPTGLAQTLQSSNITTRQFAILPASGSSISAVGTTATTTGTVTNPQQTTSSISSRQRRFNLATGTTAGTVASVRSAQTEIVRGNSVNVGGFDFYARFTLENLVSGMRAFVGVMDVTTAPSNVDPTTSTTPGKIGMAINTNTGQWNVVYNVTGTAPTVIALTTNYPVDTTTVLELWLHADPNGGGITYRVCNIVNAGILAEQSGTLTTNIPTNTTYLAPVAWVTNNATASNASISISRMIGESLDGS